MAIVGSTSGYVALGFSSDGSMVGSKAIIGHTASTGAVTAGWYDLNGKSSSAVASTAAYGLTVGGGSLVNGKTTIKFVLDNANAPSTFTPTGGSVFLWALGSSTTLSEHASKGSFRLNLASGEAASVAVPFSVWQWQLIHGLFMFVGWGVVLPMGVLVARFFKGRLNTGQPKRWYVLHRSLQLFGLLLTLVGFILSLTREEFGEIDTKHGSLGIIVMSLGLMQPLNAFLRPHKPSSAEPKSTLRTAWEWLHKSNGYIVLSLAVATIFMGIGRLNYIAELSGTASGVIWYIVYAVVLVAFLLQAARWSFKGSPTTHLKGAEA